MIFRNRALARAGAGAAGLLAAGALATPAFAADSADLAIKVTGTTISADASGKFSTVSLINNSTDMDAKGVLVTLDISKLDQKKVAFVDKLCGEPKDDKVYCGIEGDVLGAGEDIDWLFPLQRMDGATGDAGQLTVTIEHEGEDPNKSNNSATVAVKVGGNGVDLVTLADDLRESIDLAKSTDGPEFTGKPIHPGDSGALIVAVANQGDRTAQGVQVSATLPKHTSFAEKEEGCTYTNNDMTITCDVKGAVLVPMDKDTGEGGEVSVGFFWFPVKVSADAKAPVTLTGGTVTTKALGEREYGALSIAAAPALPDFAKVDDARAVKDVDASDNTDEFSVIVAATDGGSGGGLPVTGVQAGVIGGVGAAVVAAGVAMFLMARRRRVVLVTPADEKSTN